LIAAALAVVLAATAPDATGARLAEIRRDLAAERGPAHAWWWGWTLGFGAAAAGQATAAVLVDPGPNRDGLAVGAVGAGIGFVSMLLLPFPAYDAVDRFDALPEATDAERAAKLEAGEQLLAYAANREDFGRSWLSHAGGLLVATGLGLYLWQVRDRPSIALRNFAGGIVVGQLRIRTQPDALPDAWTDYRTRWTAPDRTFPLFGYSTTF
jgi:hypothetical protein